MIMNRTARSVVLGLCHDRVKARSARCHNSVALFIGPSIIRRTTTHPAPQLLSNIHSLSFADSIHLLWVLRAISTETIEIVETLSRNFRVNEVLQYNDITWLHNNQLFWPNGKISPFQHEESQEVRTEIIRNRCGRVISGRR